MTGPSPKGSARPGGPRPAWVSVAARQSPAQPAREPPPGKSRGRLPLVIGAVLVLVGGALLAMLLRGRGDDALERYTRARALFEKGQEVEAMTEVRAIETRTDDPGLRDLLRQLKSEIELAPKLKTISQLIESRSFAVAEQQLAEVLRGHPQSAQARLLRTSLRAAMDAPSTAPPPTSQALSRPAKPVERALPVAEKAQPEKAPPVKPPRAARPATSRGRHSRVSPPAPPKTAALTLRSAVRPEPAKDVSGEPATGRVRVEASEPCRVFVDGADTGRTTPAVLTLAAGTHVIAARSMKDGIARKEQSVTVGAGVNSMVTFALRAKAIRPIDSKNPYGGK